MKWWDKIIKGIDPDEEERFGDVFEDDEIYGVFGGGMEKSNTDMGDFTAAGGYAPYGNQNQDGYSPFSQQGYQTVQPQNNSVITVSQNNNNQFSVELKVVKPEECNSPNEIADYLLSGKTVILNLEETSKETSRRLIDYLRGVTYAVRGQTERVSSKTFVITPSNIIISSDSLKEDSRRNTRTDSPIISNEI